MTENPNLNYINDLASGSEEFKEKLVAIVKREFPLEKDVFLKNYTEKEYEMAAENVHKLKHKIGMLGLESAYQTAVDFEEELLSGGNSLFSKFMCTLDTIEDFLTTI